MLIELYNNTTKEVKEIKCESLSFSVNGYVSYKIDLNTPVITLKLKDNESITVYQERKYGY